MSFDFASENPFAGTTADSPFAGFEPVTPADGCTQCAMCLPSCPTYLKSEDPQQSPMGRIRLMRALEDGSSEGIALEKLESCLGCYSCEEVCPSRVAFGSRLDASLAQIRKERPLPAITRAMLTLARKGTLLRSLMRVAYLAQLTGVRALLSRLGLYRLTGLARANALLGKVAYLRRPINRTNQERAEGRVALFTGCFSSVLEQAVQQAAIDVLNTLGLEVTQPKGQGCCGALHRHSGELETAETMARHNIRAFAGVGTHVILTTSSGCGAGLKAYGKWLEGEELTTPVMDVSHYLADALKERAFELKHTPLRVALHTPCTLRQGEGQEAAVMELLQMIPGLEVIPLSGRPSCCGAGGSQMLSQPETADALRDDMVGEIASLGADVVVSSNLGCAMHLRQGLHQAASDVPLLHPVQLVAQAVVS